ncbi:MAG: UvrD-helicase domain-containing protein, partial [Caldimonas sp.]
MSAPAFRVDDRIVSREQFYAVACDPRRSVVVEACAGSGKTWMLVARILRALLDGAEAHEVLAITFTRAAAGEMRERLGDWLARWAAPRSTHGERVEALIERGLGRAEAERLAPVLGALQGKLLAAGRRVEIRTFHAWFAQLLRSAPLELLEELGLQPDMTLVEDPEEHRGAVMRAFHVAVLRDPQLADDYGALSASRGRSQLGKWLAAAWSRRIEIELADAAGVLETSVETAAALWPELEGLADPASLVTADAWRARLRTTASELGRGGAIAQRAANGVLAALDVVEARAAFEGVWSALFTNDDTRRKLGNAVPSLEETHERLELLRAQVVQSDARVEHLRMARLARALLAEYAGYKRLRGLADMADLERCALALLGDSALAGWIQERLDARVRHLLIDEFQDTSPLQWQAIRSWLASYAGAGGGASGQRPPSVFIVGDPKQSLYRFRGAEPRIFEQASAFVAEALDGRRLACDHTRRNAPRVVEAINAVFEPAAAAGEFSGFRRHTTEVAAAAGDEVRALPRNVRIAKARADAAAGWRDSLVVPRATPEEALREREAAMVAAGIAELTVDRGVEAREIYVLARKRQSLRFAALALQRAHIRHGAVEEATLMEGAEAQDLVALLDVLASPTHGLSLARALKSPVLGASDADLVALAEAAGASAGWWRTLHAMAAPSDALRRAQRLLASWAEAAERLPPHDLLDRIVDEGELRERTLAAVPAEQRQQAGDAVDAVLAQALMLDGARYATPYGFVRALKRRILKAALPVRADAVRLLTIHGAKGLEADTVFVMDTEPEAPPVETTTLLVDWPVDAGRPARCAFVYAESQCPRSLQPLLAVEQAAREREALNALYVAMTRARHRLVFSATEPMPRSGAGMAVPMRDRCGSNTICAVPGA